MSAIVTRRRLSIFLCVSCIVASIVLVLDKDTVSSIHSNSVSIKTNSIFRQKSTNSNDIHSLYSEQARLRLQEIFRQRKTISICANGGSSTAGAGIPAPFRYFERLASFVQDDLHKNVSLIDRGHGARDSFHSSMLFHSFIPESVDILIWEFSINDFVEARVEYEARNGLLLWLKAIQKHMAKNPPLVILAYLWDSPFSMTQNTHVNDSIYQEHTKGLIPLGAEFDFVVGHFNFAAYLDNLGLGYTRTEDEFLLDEHHPNYQGHQRIGEGLYQFIRMVLDGSLLPIPVRATPITKSEYMWPCGVTSHDQNILKNIMLSTDGLSKASYTEDIPRNMAPRYGMIRPYLLLSNGSVAAIQTAPTLFGKANPKRQDRQFGWDIPSCSHREYMSFDISAFSPIRTIQLFFPTVQLTKRSITVLVNGTRRKEKTSYRILAAKNWNGCGIETCITKYLFSHWIIFSEGEPVEIANISFCSKVKGLALEHMALF